MSYYVRVSVTCVLLIMHNYHAIYVLIYYSGIRVKNLNFGLKNMLIYMYYIYMYVYIYIYIYVLLLLLCITDMY